MPQKIFLLLGLAALCALFCLSIHVFFQLVRADPRLNHEAAEKARQFGYARYLNNSDLPSPTPTPTVTPWPAVVVEASPDIVSPEVPPEEFNSANRIDAAFGTRDVDCDGVSNRDDNCPFAFNPSQKDKNKNGTGDACEGANAGKIDERCDIDGDGVLDRDDNCKLVCNPDQKDSNKNGIGDFCDPDLLDEWVRIDPCRKPVKKNNRPKTKKRKSHS